jgi:predicted RecB family nuclease
MNPLDHARKWFRLSRRINSKRLHRDLGVPADEPIPWMEAECPACPFTCPDCGSSLTEYVHDGWECLSCGVVF